MVQLEEEMWLQKVARLRRDIEWMQTLNKGTWRAGEVRGRDVVTELSNNEKRHWMELANRVAND